MFYCETYYVRFNCYDTKRKYIKLMASMEISHITEQHCVLLPAVRLCDMATQCSAIFILCLLTENVETIYLFRMTIFEISGAILMQMKKLFY